MCAERAPVGTARPLQFVWPGRQRAPLPSPARLLRAFERDRNSVPFTLRWTGRETAQLSAVTAVHGWARRGGVRLLRSDCVHRHHGCRARNEPMRVRAAVESLAAATQAAAR